MQQLWSRSVKTFDSTSPHKSHFVWETTHCGPMALKFDYCIWGSFWSAQLETSLSARSLWSTPMDPIVTLQDINAVGRPCKTTAKIPKVIILGHGKGDSCAAPSNFLRRSWKKRLTRILLNEFCLALGEPSLQLATSTYKQTHPQWISGFLHCGTRHRRHDVPIKNCALMRCLQGRVLQDFRCRSCFCLNSISILWHLSHCVEIGICRVHSFGLHIS